jgi:hypothetical protein
MRVALPAEQRAMMLPPAVVNARLTPGPPGALAAGEGGGWLAPASARVTWLWVTGAAAVPARPVPAASIAMTPTAVAAAAAASQPVTASGERAGWFMSLIVVA